MDPREDNRPKRSESFSEKGLWPGRVEATYPVSFYEDADTSDRYLLKDREDIDRRRSWRRALTTVALRGSAGGWPIRGV
jgi:hypothetical protein